MIHLEHGNKVLGAPHMDSFLNYWSGAVPLPDVFLFNSSG